MVPSPAAVVVVAAGAVVVVWSEVATPSGVVGPSSSSALAPRKAPTPTTRTSTTRRKPNRPRLIGARSPPEHREPLRFRRGLEDVVPLPRLAHRGRRLGGVEVAGIERGVVRDLGQLLGEALVE